MSPDKSLIRDARRAKLAQLTHAANHDAVLNGNTADNLYHHTIKRDSLEEAFTKGAGFTQEKHERELKVVTEQSEQEATRLNTELVVSNQQLAAANCDLEMFSYTVAHDLRSPIRQIAGFSKILIEDYGWEFSAEARRYLDKVVQGAAQMGALVDDLLRFAQASRQVLKLQVTQLNSILAAAIASLQFESVGRNINWQIDNLGSVECDHALMQQVLVNLLSNALKYTRRRDLAVIEIGRMSLHDEQVIFVRDNGVGFDMKYASKLFGAFHRLHPDSEFEGTGIGLSIVERIIHKHGGKIWAQAEPDHGATFFFTVCAAGACHQS